MASGGANRTGRAARSSYRQDWVNLILAGWLFISPWVLGFGGTVATPTFVRIDGNIPAIAAADAAWNAWIAGGVVFMISLSAIDRPRPWHEWVVLVVAAWIFAAPWVVGFAGLNAPAFEHWIIGGLIFLSAFSSLRAVRATRRGDRSGVSSPKP